jgi:hypothetical protein
MRAGVLVAVCLLLAGCYRYVGPVVVSVKGSHVVTCDFVAGSSFFTVGADRFENCRDENGTKVDAPPTTDPGQPGQYGKQSAK